MIDHSISKTFDGRYEVAVNRGGSRARAGLVMGSGSTWLGEAADGTHIGRFHTRAAAASALALDAGDPTWAAMESALHASGLRRSNASAADDRRMLRDWKQSTDFVWILADGDSLLLPSDMSWMAARNKLALQACAQNPASLIYTVAARSDPGKVEALGLAQAMKRMNQPCRFQMNIDASAIDLCVSGSVRRERLATIGMRTDAASHVIQVNCTAGVFENDVPALLSAGLHVASTLPGDIQEHASVCVLRRGKELARVRVGPPQQNHKAQNNNVRERG